MDKKHLGRVLSEKIAPYCTMSYWQVKRTVETAIEDSLQVTSQVDELIDLMRKGIVRFCYKKQDGSTREAIGTLKPSILDGFSAGRKTRRQSTSDCIVYFDLEREEWRCFCPENFITRF